MRRENGLEDIEKTGAALITVGSFDGVHIGHQAIVRYLVERARNQQSESVVVTFDPHPREVLTGQTVPLLSTIEERAESLEALGLDRFIVLPFTKAFAALSPEEFVLQILVGRIGLREIVVGYDHGFGQGRRGDVTMLHTLGGAHGFSVDVIPPQAVEHQVVSSTEIRGALTERGAVREAAAMLRRNYGLRGTVIHGDGRGHTIGYPTANIAVDDPRKVIPRRGVYAVHVYLDGDTTRYNGMMNIGYRPTFDGTAKLHLEVHLLDFDHTIYGRALRVLFVERLRDEQKFDGIEALVAQLAEDEQHSRRVLAG